VVAKRALELLASAPAATGVVHPLDHENRSQSTNDTYPTAVKQSLLSALEGLSVAARGLAETCQAKSREFWSVPQVGRMQMQDAVADDRGQEFSAWSATLARMRHDSGPVRNAWTVGIGRRADASRRRPR
jgi:aspartate ammonia-lyase